MCACACARGVWLPQRAIDRPADRHAAINALEHACGVGGDVSPRPSVSVRLHSTLSPTARPRPISSEISILAASSRSRAAPRAMRSLSDSLHLLHLVPSRAPRFPTADGQRGRARCAVPQLQWQQRLRSRAPQIRIARGHTSSHNTPRQQAHPRPDERHRAHARASCRITSNTFNTLPLRR
jgi:hypothetical protein